MSVSAPAVWAQKLSPEEAAGNFEYCLVCHGYTANGNQAIQAPAIAGIEPWYLEAKLESYRSGVRGANNADSAGAEMMAVAREISASQLQPILEFLTSYPVAPQPSEMSSDPVRGKRQFDALCAACHGADGQGNEALKAPGLVRLNDWYIVDSFNKYRNGERGSSQLDVPGFQMQMMVEQLPEDFSIQDVTRYIKTLDQGLSGGNP